MKSDWLNSVFEDVPKHNKAKDCWLIIGDFFIFDIKLVLIMSHFIVLSSAERLLYYSFIHFIFIFLLCHW